MTKLPASGNSCEARWSFELILNVESERVSEANRIATAAIAIAAQMKWTA